MSVVNTLKSALPEQSKPVLRWGVRRFGGLTSSMRPLPDYLVIGTKRGGTTSMWDHLMRHPSVLRMFPSTQNVKSPHYFDINWSRGEQWYRSFFPSQRAREALSAATGERALCGEASPYYMFHPLARERIKATVPEAKIIVLLRNPVVRAYSHYNERRLNGTEPLTFREALDAEADRLSGEAELIEADPGYYSERHDFCSYLARGRYLEHLGPWLDDFGKDQLLVLRSEDLYASPADLMARVFEFLGLSPYRLEQPERRNAVPAAPMDPGDREWLADYYAPSVAALEERLGRSLSWNLRGR